MSEGHPTISYHFRLYCSWGNGPQFLAVKSSLENAQTLQLARRPPCGWDLASIEANRVGGMAVLLDGNWQNTLSLTYDWSVRLELELLHVYSFGEFGIDVNGCEMQQRRRVRVYGQTRHV
jgi:hypothetical protein